MVFGFLRTEKGLRKGLSNINIQIERVNTLLDTVREEIIELANEYKEKTPRYQLLKKRQDELIRIKDKLQIRFNGLTKALERKAA